MAYAGASSKPPNYAPWEMLGQKTREAKYCNHLTLVRIPERKKKNAVLL